MNSEEQPWPQNFTGGCQCGAVRYDASAAPASISYCHCRMCQRAFGNLFAPLVSVKREALRWSKGSPKIFRSSSVAERGFCADCGTPLTFGYLAEEEVAVSLGSLDQPELFPPQIHYGIESRLSWLHMEDGLPSQETGAEASERERLAGMSSYQG